MEHKKFGKEKDAQDKPIGITAVCITGITERRLRSAVFGVFQSLHSPRTRSYARVQPALGHGWTHSSEEISP